MKKIMTYWWPLLWFAVFFAMGGYFFSRAAYLEASMAFAFGGVLFWLDCKRVDQNLAAKARLREFLAPTEFEQNVADSALKYGVEPAETPIEGGAKKCFSPRCQCQGDPFFKPRD